MALPAVLIKAKNGIKKAATAKKAANNVKSAGEEVEEGIKKGLGRTIAITITILLLPFFLIIVFIVVIVMMPQTLYTMFGAVDGNSSKNTSTTSVSAGEAANIEGEDNRIAWLYDGNGVPQTEEQNEQYLETFEISYLDETGVLKSMDIKMHKKLKTEVQAIFQDLINIGFKLEWSSGGGAMRGWDTDVGYKGKFYQSAHSYGHAIDINVDANPYDGAAGHVGGTYSPGIDPFSVTEEVVNIWKKHGFYWGGDWNNPKDYMHFSYFNH